MRDCTCTIDVAGVPSSAAIASPGARPATAAADPAATADTTTAPAASTASVTPSAARRGKASLGCGHAETAPTNRTAAANAAHAYRLVTTNTLSNGSEGPTRDHSVRSAVSGSARLARRAGRYAAHQAARPRTSGAPIWATGSKLPTPK